MIKKTCAAPDCDKTFIPKMPHARYCCPQCRSRVYKSGVYKERVAKGLCPQCGGEMDNSGPSYCKSCQVYFRDRYYDKLKKG